VEEDKSESSFIYISKYYQMQLEKSILIGALGASLLFVSIGAGINSSEQTTSGKWQFYPAAEGIGYGNLLDTESGRLYYVEKSTKEHVEHK
tara:strand:- start:81 stop:353 length:273 start_codon:yes stop_codon:yes gene_type:complete